MRGPLYNETLVNCWLTSQRTNLEILQVGERGLSELAAAEWLDDSVYTHTCILFECSTGGETNQILSCSTGRSKDNSPNIRETRSLPSKRAGGLACNIPKEEERIGAFVSWWWLECQSSQPVCCQSALAPPPPSGTIRSPSTAAVQNTTRIYIYPNHTVF